ncbi:ATP11 protein-domain-containing protein [Aspergillus floccosus]
MIPLYRPSARLVRPQFHLKRCASVQTGGGERRLTPAQRVYRRYGDKLAHRARILGLESIDQLRETHRQEIDSLRRSERIHTTASHPGVPPIPAPFTPPAAPRVPPVGDRTKTLAAYVDVDKMRALGVKEIEAVWRLRHAESSNSLCATIPAETFQQMKMLARQHPRFVLPLPASDADEGAVSMHYVEWKFASPTIVAAIITHLDEYKNRGEFATPHTVITHHLDLAPEKGIVLLHGSVTDHCGVSTTDARWLLLMLQKFYGGVGTSPRRHGLLSRFNQGSEAFDLEELLDVAETVS